MKSTPNNTPSPKQRNAARRVRERIPDPHDRRVIRLQLTERGPANEFYRTVRIAHEADLLRLTWTFSGGDGIRTRFLYVAKVWLSVL